MSRSHDWPLDHILDKTKRHIQQITLLNLSPKYGHILWMAGWCEKLWCCTVSAFNNIVNKVQQPQTVILDALFSTSVLLRRQNVWSSFHCDKERDAVDCLLWQRRAQSDLYVGFHGWLVRDDECCSASASEEQKNSNCCSLLAVI